MVNNNWKSTKLSPIRWTALLALLVSASVSCNSGEASKPTAAVPGPTTTTTKPAALGSLSMEASRPKIYRPIAELRKDASIVVIVTVTGSSEDEIMQIPFTISNVTVDRVLAGKASIGDQLKVRQTGRGIDSLGDLPPLITKNSRYLLFLTPSLAPGKDPAELSIVGGGLWKIDLPSGRTTRLDPQSLDLPDGLSVDDMARQIS